MSCNRTGTQHVVRANVTIDVTGEWLIDNTTNNYRGWRLIHVFPIQKNVIEGVQDIIGNALDDDNEHGSKRTLEEVML